jgi:hypothetical protein
LRVSLRSNAICDFNLFTSFLSAIASSYNVRLVRCILTCEVVFIDDADGDSINTGNEGELCKCFDEGGDNADTGLTVLLE